MKCRCKGKEQNNHRMKQKIPGNLIRISALMLRTARSMVYSGSNYRNLKIKVERMADMDGMQLGLLGNTDPRGQRKRNICRRE